MKKPRITLLQKIEHADELTKLWQAGKISKLNLKAALLDLGFFDLEFRGHRVFGKVTSARLELGR